MPINIRSLQGCAHSVAAFVGPSGEPPRDRRLPRRSLSHDRAQPAARSPKPLNKTTKPFSFSWTKPRELRGDPSLWAHVLVTRRHCCSRCLFHEPIVDVARGMKARRAHPGRSSPGRAGSGAEYAWHGVAWHGGGAHGEPTHVVSPGGTYRQCSAPSRHAGRPSGRRTLQSIHSSDSIRTSEFERWCTRVLALRESHSRAVSGTSHRRVPQSSAASLSSA